MGNLACIVNVMAWALFTFIYFTLFWFMVSFPQFFLYFAWLLFLHDCLLLAIPLIHNSCMSRICVTLPEQCSLPKQTGDCSEKHARWHFSETEKRCLPFYYTGCGGNKNSFPTLESCETHCPRQVGKLSMLLRLLSMCANLQPKKSVPS